VCAALVQVAALVVVGAVVLVGVIVRRGVFLWAFAVGGVAVRSGVGDVRCSRHVLGRVQLVPLVGFVRKR